MPDPTLSSADFEFTEGGALVIRWRDAASRVGENRGDAGGQDAPVEQGTSSGIELSRDSAG